MVPTDAMLDRLWGAALPLERGAPAAQTPRILKLRALVLSTPIEPVVTETPLLELLKYCSWFLIGAERWQGAGRSA